MEAVDCRVTEQMNSLLIPFGPKNSTNPFRDDYGLTRFIGLLRSEKEENWRQAIDRSSGKDRISP
jgi:hypothetical protein